jgi:GNAT superfamily N-acetyltransferase
MLNSYGDAMTMTLHRDGPDWALLSLLPVRASDWDRKMYPDAEYIAFVEGSSSALKLGMLEKLPDCRLVVKTGDPRVQEFLSRRPGAARVTSFRSFTTGPESEKARGTPGALPEEGRDDTPWHLFALNGYEPDELRRYFENGARWFGCRLGDGLRAACFVYQNYKEVWEIAGVYTEPAFRRRGLARAVVVAALIWLRSQGKIPRYQVREDNTASISLAESCGLVEFLRVDHFVLSPQGPIPR